MMRSRWFPAAKQFLGATARRGRRPSSGPVRLRLGVEALEVRLTPASAWLPTPVEVPATASRAAGPQVVFFEANVADYQVLAQGLPAGAQAVVLDPGGDGLDQMAVGHVGRSRMPWPLRPAQPAHRWCSSRRTWPATRC